MTTALEDAFRRDWPQILGAVVRYTSDLQLAEDSVQEAFARAVAAGPEAEMLRNPSAWITTVARRIAVDSIRRARALERALPGIAVEIEREGEVEMPTEPVDFVGDERLLLIVLVCDPALSEETRVALALRFVCNVPTSDLADLFLVSEPTMAARLTRAKKRIRDTGVRFQVSDADALRERIDDVLTTLYLLYTVGHTAPRGSRVGSEATRQTAIALARDVTRFVPDHREAAGLLALLLLTDARQNARVDEWGDVLSLEEADRSRWGSASVDEGYRLASFALAGRGRFALQAGISGLHTEAPRWEDTDWPGIARLYDRLREVWPSPSVTLNRIVARSYSDEIGPAMALVELDEARSELVPALDAQYLATRGDLLRRLGRRLESIDAYSAALEYEQNEQLRGFLARRIRSLRVEP